MSDHLRTFKDEQISYISHILEVSGVVVRLPASSLPLSRSLSADREHWLLLDDRTYF